MPRLPPGFEWSRGTKKTRGTGPPTGPVTAEQAELVGAEHFAFCPDNVVQGLSGGTIRAYAAREVLGKTDWWFWWD
jgi:hypothetical protein